MATMIKVLAAEMSDQQRLARGKRYHADESVIDIVVGHGAVTAEVQGGRPEPYVVTIEADGGSGVPPRRELWVRCSCPDDSGTGSDMCKHAVAAMFALSDEVAVEPELVDRWRASRRRPARDAPVGELADVTPLDAHRPSTGTTPAPDRDEPATVIPLPTSGRDAEAEPDAPLVDPAWGTLPVMLRSPAGAVPPEFPDVDEIDHRSLRDETLRTVLDDALDHLHLRWE
jgi:hypothetical protein